MPRFVKPHPYEHCSASLLHIQLGVRASSVTLHHHSFSRQHARSYRRHGPSIYRNFRQHGPSFTIGFPNNQRASYPVACRHGYISINNGYSQSQSPQSRSQSTALHFLCTTNRPSACPGNQRHSPRRRLPSGARCDCEHNPGGMQTVATLLLFSSICCGEMGLRGGNMFQLLRNGTLKV